MKRKITLLPQY